jgi:methoxymalonate biosynthesis acyl carrier protein
MTISAQQFPAALLRFVSEEVATAAGVTSRSELLLSGLVDSLGVVRIVDWIEVQLALRIDPGDVLLENFETVNAMVAFLELCHGIGLETGGSA